MKNKKIKFVALNEWSKNIADPPVPSKKIIAPWYKKAQKTKNNEKFDLEHYNTNLTIKACIPVMDSMLAGYTIILPVDLLVKQTGEAPLFTWMIDSFVPIEVHMLYQTEGYPVPQGYNPIPFKFMGSWRIDTPKGYSIWYTHPSHRFDLPFYTLTGFVDADKTPNPINFPFFIKKDFEGIIPKGTPIAQAIPVKRDSWSHEVLGPDLNAKWGTEKVRSMVRNYYRNNLWEKKKYN